MTAKTILTDAPSACKLNWKYVDWKSVNRHVFRLQVRIAKAIQLLFEHRIAGDSQKGMTF